LNNHPTFSPAEAIIPFASAGVENWRRPALRADGATWRANDLAAD
jgi:hypothetical protein